MTNPPICQFGPGGEFVRPWPPSAQPIQPAADVEATGAELAQDAARQGLETPLVSVGPAGIDWQDQPITGLAADALAAAAGSIIRLLERSAEAHGSTPLSDETRDRAIRRLAEDLAAAEEPVAGVVKQRTMRADDVAMPAPAPGRVLADAGYVLAAETDKESRDAKEINLVHPHAEADGSPASDSSVSATPRLFPDDAGDWGPVGLDQSDRVRTRRRPRKKRAGASRCETHGSLFAGLS